MLPGAPPSARQTIVYDGSCEFCRRQIAWIRERDRAGAFAFTPAQTPDLFEQHPQLASEQLSTGLRLIDATGAVHVGADAVYRIARQMPGWRWVALGYRVPGMRMIGRAAYAFVARRRERLGRRGSPCARHERT